MVPLLKSIFFAGILYLASDALAQSKTEVMQHNFQHPPDSAGPRVWWQWMNGNVTEEGITADLDWMHRVGIAGMQMIDGDVGVPVYVDNDHRKPGP